MNTIHCGVRKCGMKTSRKLTFSRFSFVFFSPSSIVHRLAIPLLFLLLLSACSSTPKLPDPPPRYVYPKNEKNESSRPLPTANSLWNDTASLYEDVKARRLNDLVTINVIENMTGSGTADTKAGKKSTYNAGIENLLGFPLTFNTTNLYGKGKNFSPTITGSSQDDFKGNGSTTRSGNLIGTITAKVVEVMPNGTLALESRKEITINNEKQILILRGIVRPDDIGIDNTVLSSRVSDAEVFFVGDGIVQNKQKPGWLVGILDLIWPF